MQSKTTSRRLDIPVSNLNSSLFFINSLALLEPSVMAGLVGMLILLFVSALIAAAEVGFFSLVPSQIAILKNTYTPGSQKAVQLLEKPKNLLATIVVAHNLVNVGVIVISETIFHKLFDFSTNPAMGFVIQVVIVTFLILLIGEVIPKIYSTQNALKTANRLVYVVVGMQKLLWPLTSVLIYLTSLIDSRIKQQGHNISVDDLSHALELTSNEHTPEQEQKILKGIVEFGNTEVRQIMKARLDVVAFDCELSFSELIAKIVESGFSRVPVYKDSLDNIQGILYIKDLLAHLGAENFDWKSLIRPALFVPENKKIDDLMKEFQTKKNHLAVVVDEYGGTNGIVTLEDIIEEVVGDIKDEFDEDELTYSKLDDLNYVFEGKILLNDLYRVLEIDAEEFEAVKGESDTLAGFILELSGKIPQKFEKITHRDFIFEIESVDKRRIKRVKVTLPKRQKPDGETDGPKLFSAKLNSFLLVICATSTFLLSSCESEFSPRPKGYLRIDFPAKEYALHVSDCPFQFEIPKYCTTIPYKGTQVEKCWFDLDYPKYKAKIHLSYFDLKNDLNKHLEDSRSLAYKHTVKADGIEELPFLNPVKRVYGLVYTISGNAASSLQFYITDSTKHFVRGALYFNASPNSDSTAPVLQFIKADVTKMVETFEWEK